MAYYFTRHGSMTQATTTFSAVEIDSEGATAGPIPLPPDVKAITSIRASVVVNGAHVTDTGVIIVLRLTGTGALVDGVQELVLMSEHLEDGAGTLTYDVEKIIKPLFLPVRIAVNGGADLSVAAAYYGTDAGSPQISVTLEVV